MNLEMGKKLHHLNVLIWSPISLGQKKRLNMDLWNGVSFAHFGPP
jgi:hypothetical protein